MYSTPYLFQGAKLSKTDKEKKINSYNNRIGIKEVKTVTTVISYKL